MELQQIIQDNQKYVMNTYGRLPVAFVRGEGARLWDTEGKQYLDFVGGLAVIALGHCHPKIVAAIQKQAATLMHTSNLYHITPQVELAKRLYELSGGYKSFYCNSGAEANEGAIKLARIYAKKTWGGERFEIIVAEGSFHGRTLATLAATGQPKYHKGFEPLPEGFRHVPFNDLDAVTEAITPRTCAILMEPIQGESGIHVATPEFLRGLRELCDQRHLLLLLDEVQTEIARTGKMFVHEHYGIHPDIFTLAKSVAGGFPMGVTLATPAVAAAFEPGSHASTFGGNHLACAASLAACDVVVEEKLAERAAAVGEYFVSQLRALQSELPTIVDVRGKGLMLGVALRDKQAQTVQQECLRRGLVLNAIGDSVLRFLPPLTISEAEVDEAIVVLKESFEALSR